METLTETEIRTVFSAHGPAGERVLERVLPELRYPPPLPQDHASVIEPVRWLLERAIEGLPLDENKRLERSFAVTVNSQLGFETPDSTEKGSALLLEVDFCLMCLRSLEATETQGTSEYATGLAFIYLHDLADLWEATAEGLSAKWSDDFRQAMYPLILVWLIDRKAPKSSLLAALQEVAKREGRGMNILTIEDALSDLFGFLYTGLRTLRGVDMPPRGELTKPRLTNSGRAAALTALRTIVLNEGPDLGHVKRC
ncbi:MAG: hypothetical protein M3343_01985 [Actinomycetota bacterium]|nr:hypothetical protein [Actinomycetota bacterium]